MKFECLLVAVVFSCIIKNLESKQIFTCTKDTVGNITEIKQGTKCVFTWFYDSAS